ncbi:YhfT family protein [Neobacillus pocheonensis]|uniref:YhfT family protein n=1 Tax=Neobacillus pocheonensis TaxID=363869 RepID=A0ABT0WB47_9BACI|nr:YhfT family protein [Neobacillus pocheonensis]
MQILQNISVLDIAVIMCLTALTALASHWGKAVFHDGIRPILPEFMEGRMKRSELSSISFGLSIGFIVSVGISFAVSFKLLNPWLLFLPTDILGVMATSWWMAIGLGGIWGIVALFGLTGVQTVFSLLPVDLLGSLGELSTPVLVAFTAFPIIAILYQFGWVRALFSGLVALVVRQLLPVVGGGFTDKANTALEKARQLADVTFPKGADFAGKVNAIKKAAGQDSHVQDLLAQATNNFSLGTTISGFTMQIAVLMLMGMILLITFSIMKDVKNKVDISVDTEEENIFDIRTKRIVKGLPILAGIGALLAIATNLGLMNGSEVDGPILHQAWQATGQERSNLLQSAAIADIIRGISFIPLIATTALATGVYGVVGLTFVFPIGILMPNPVLAGIVGAIWVCIEVLALRGIGRFLQRYPSLREASDNIRSSMNSMIELALFIGGAFAAMKMAPNAVGLSLTIYILLYAANEGLGRPIMKLAAGPVAIIITGIILNLLYFLHLI